MKRICFVASILLIVAINAMGQSKDEITFTKDIAPILQQNCQSCHHAGTFAPMSLVTYDETRPWARSRVRSSSGTRCQARPAQRSRSVGWLALTVNR